MIKIVRNEKETKRYIDDIQRMFDLYKSAKRFGVEEKFEDNDFKELIKRAKDNDDYISTLKGKILSDNIMGDKTLSEIAEEENYSVAHIYNIKQKVLKEFASITFEVILV